MSATTTRVVIDAQGGSDVMRLEETELPPPGPGEVQVEQAAIGLNYMDVYQRSGAYKLDLPSPLGLEAAGTVVAIGEGVDGLAEGDRVAYAGVLGAYARLRNAPAARMVKVPDGIDFDTAAAALMKGMTVEYLLERCYKVQPGQAVLFWAASGGVGQIAGQWGRHLGAEMIGVTSGAENCARARDMGYAHAIDRNGEDVAARVREITGGDGVPVVYDSVGRASFEASIASLGVYGMFVSFGATTGPAPAVTPDLLQKSGSLYFTRPTLANYVGSRKDLEHSAGRVFDMLASGDLKVPVSQRRPLAEVAAAHDELEAGTTTGSIVFAP